MDLVDWIHKLSWRKFLVLIRGLSPNSLWFNIVRNTPDVIQDDTEAERAANDFWDK